jgi:hypothetical protein
LKCDQKQGAEQKLQKVAAGQSTQQNLGFLDPCHAMEQHSTLILGLSQSKLVRSTRATTTAQIIDHRLRTVGEAAFPLEVSVPLSLQLVQSSPLIFDQAGYGSLRRHHFLLVNESDSTLLSYQSLRCLSHLPDRRMTRSPHRSMAICIGWPLFISRIRRADLEIEIFTTKAVQTRYGGS